MGEGGSGGDGSELPGGNAGVGGEGAPACESDEACDDGASCNGVERCVDGACEAGDAVDCASGAEGCEAVCDEDASGTECLTRAADADGDGHGSSQCEVSPGADCNDENADVHAGAPEICDALDNDCDGSADLSDGLLLDTTSVTLQGFGPSVAWSEHHAAFGVMWTARSGATNELRGGTLSTTGMLQPWSVISFSSTSATYLSPVLIDNGTRFAVLYQTGSRSGQLSHFAMIESDGTAQSTQLDALHADVARGDDGTFTFAGEWAGVSTIDVQPPAGVTQRSSFDTAPVSPRVAMTGSDAAAIWQVENTTNVVGMLYLDGAFVTPPFGAVERAASPDITAAGAGYAAAWITSNGMFFQRMTSDGSLSCVGTEVTLPTAATDDRSLAIASTDQHSLVLLTDKLNGAVTLLRFDDQCRLVDQAEAAATVETPSRPSIAVGGGHVAACWSEGAGENHSECRVMGVSLCEGNASASRRVRR